MDHRELFVIIGITGNQGGSVAKTFLSDPELSKIYKLRGVTRDPSSKAAQVLATQGIELVQANLHDPESLAKAFAAANVIFSVTDFWAPFFDPENQAKAAEQGKSIGQYAYELEYAQGCNIADAAASVPELERFVVSMLSSPKKWSKGRYNKLWHYESKADMITYIETKYPALAAKMSCLNMGVFFHSWKVVPLIGPRRMEDGTYVLTLPSKGETPGPLVDPTNDTGPFVRALLQLEPDVQVYGETSMRSWKEWLVLWGDILGKNVRYEEVSIEFYEEVLASQGTPPGFGTEIAEMFAYMEKCGYNGSDPECKRKEEVSEQKPDQLRTVHKLIPRELGIDIGGLSSVEEYILNEDWGFEKSKELVGMY